LDLVRETDEGTYRFTLPFATSEERGNHICPDVVGNDFVTARDTLYEIVLSTVDDIRRTADPDDPVGGTFYGPCLDGDPLRGELPWISPWIRVARLLSDAPSSTDQTVRFGATIEQIAL
jgi:hypothetical protein